MVNGKFFTLLLFNIKWIKKFKFIQQEYDVIDLLVVTEDTAADIHVIHAADIVTLRRTVANVFGSACVLNVIHVDSIPTSASGKYLYTESKLAMSQTS